MAGDRKEIVSFGVCFSTDDYIVVVWIKIQNVRIFVV